MTTLKRVLSRSPRPGAPCSSTARHDIPQQDGEECRCQNHLRSVEFSRGACCLALDDDVGLVRFAMAIYFLDIPHYGVCSCYPIATGGRRG